MMATLPYNTFVFISIQSSKGVDQGGSSINHKEKICRNIYIPAVLDISIIENSSSYYHPTFLRVFQYC